MLKTTLRFVFTLSVAVLALLEPDARAQEGDGISLFVGRSQKVTTEWEIGGASLTDPEVADVQVLTPRLMVVSGRAPGVTDMLVWSEDGTKMLERRIQVDIDLARLRVELANMFPEARLRVELSEGVTVVQGLFERAEQAQQLHAYLEARDVPFVDQTTLPGVQQVQAKIRFAEVFRNAGRQLGINMFKTGDTFFGGSLAGGATNSVIPTFDGGDLGDLGNTAFSFVDDLTGGEGITLFAGWPKADFSLFISALDENDYLRVMAEPTLVALSGEEANFLAGGEFPIPVVQGGGGDSVTVEYKEFGIGLAFKPVVLGDGTIRLRIRSEVSDRNDVQSVKIPGTDAEVPAITRRSAETTLEMRSGQSFAMAGLLNETTRARRSKVPGLGDLPILGPLFRSVRYQSGQSELVVIVTVDLVEPFDAETLPPLPGQDHRAPSDWELYAEGRIEAATPGRMADSEAPFIRALGLDGLKGPGAWSWHGQPPAPPRPSPDWVAQQQQQDPAAEVDDLAGQTD